MNELLKTGWNSTEARIKIIIFSDKKAPTSVPNRNTSKQEYAIVKSQAIQIALQV